MQCWKGEVVELWVCIPETPHDEQPADITLRVTESQETETGGETDRNSQDGATQAHITSVGHWQPGSDGNGRHEVGHAAGLESRLRLSMHREERRIWSCRRRLNLRSYDVYNMEDKRIEEPLVESN